MIIQKILVLLTIINHYYPSLNMLSIDTISKHGPPPRPSGKSLGDRCPKKRVPSGYKKHGKWPMKIDGLPGLPMKKLGFSIATLNNQRFFIQL
jgi:hypothetical protein